MITESAFVTIAGLVAVIALLFLTITRFKWHVFLAMLVPISGPSFFMDRQSRLSPPSPGWITAASVTAPMMGTLGLSREATMLAGAAGSMIVKYPNSSYFWVCTSLSRMPLRSALFAYGGVTLVGGLVSMAVVHVLWVFGRI